VVPWIAPVALALLFLCLFPTWVGTYLVNDRETSYTQSGWGIGFGREFSGLGLLYLLLLLLTLLLVWANILVPLLGVHLPPQVKQFWPHRLPILVVATVILFLLLFVEMLSGFGLGKTIEKAVEKPATMSDKKEESKPPTPEERLARGLSQDPRFAQLTLYRSFWAWLAFLLQIAALVGVLLEFWLDRRGSRPLPKMELAW
jgi:hypothetical protein